MVMGLETGEGREAGVVIGGGGLGWFWGGNGVVRAGGRWWL